ncbi:MAG: isochorismatase family protein [Longimicrobiales bacterium]
MAAFALIAVDVQNDFCAGGALAVPNGDRVVPVLNQAIARTVEAGGLILASRDWHPARTAHFRSGGGRWPPHCVQGTPGAAFHPGLELPAECIVITKGDNPRDDGYSAFEGKDEDGHMLEQRLARESVRRLIMGGLATDYCVRTSALDGLNRGFDVVLLVDAMHGIEVEEGDVARAFDAMLRAGARTATLATLATELKPSPRLS